MQIFLFLPPPQNKSDLCRGGYIFFYFQDSRMSILIDMLPAYGHAGSMSSINDMLPAYAHAGSMSSLIDKQFIKVC